MSKSELANLQEILSSPTIRENKEIDQLQGIYLSINTSNPQLVLKVIRCAFRTQSNIYDGAFLQK